jgi:prepilin-type N-terminal cleavage/methylation domain-containing protein
METIRIKARSGSAGIASVSIKARSVSAGIPSAHRSAFTLVELLVVIGIIALLAAIVTPAVMRAQATARNAAIKAEIDMLHMAIMNYKNEYGSFPPCYDANPSATLTNGAMTSVAQKHLQRLFPRCTNVSGPTGQFQNSVGLTPATALIAWLSGFNSDSTLPLLPIIDKKKLFDFDTSRLGHIDPDSPTTTRLVYMPSQKPESPYIYIHNSQYGTPWPPTAYKYYVGNTEYRIEANTYSAVPDPNEPGKFFNNDSFQILNAGRDGTWASNGPDDDLSNFWPGTRKDYADSRK